MSPPSTIKLELTAGAIDTYCRDLVRRTATPEKCVSAIDALITFIAAQTDAGEQAKPEFRAIREVLSEHFERARAALLQERAGQLLQALEAQRLPAITSIYASLSRDAFWSLLERIARQLDGVALAGLRAWTSQWLTEAQQKARAASPYPDAVDFKAAGIDASEFLAMTDLGRFLGAGG